MKEEKKIDVSVLKLAVNELIATDKNSRIFSGLVVPEEKCN